MSTVYRATDLSLDRIVAVKVALDPLVEQSPIYLARFTREAQAAAALSHPGVVTVYDAGADGPTRFIVMEYVQGRSLAEIMREREQQPLEPDQAARIAEQVADALSAAHAAGIVHRDIKPGNIMITPRRVGEGARLRDRAGARQPHAHADRDRARHLGVHVPRAGARTAGGRALGHLLARLRAVRDADRRAAVHRRRVGRGAAPARPGRAQAGARAQPGDPAGARALVMQMLAKSPDDRPQTAAEVRDRLGRALADPEDRGDALTTVAMAAVAPTPATVPTEATEPLRRNEPTGRPSHLRTKPAHRGDRAADPAATGPRAADPGTDDRVAATVVAASEHHRVLDHRVRGRRGAAGRRRRGGADRRRLRRNLQLDDESLVARPHELAHDHRSAADPSEHDLDDHPEPDHELVLELDDASPRRRRSGRPRGRPRAPRRRAQPPPTTSTGALTTGTTSP